jgi:hypothetical protein
VSIQGRRLPGERHAEVLGGKALVAQDARDLAVDLEDRGGRILQQRLRGEVHLAHLLEQLAHVLRARARAAW